MATKKPYVDTGREATSDELTKVAQWMRAAIPVLRKANNAARGLDNDQYRGVHANFGGLRVQFNAKFPDLSMTKVQKQLAEQKITASVMVRGGPMFYLWVDKPESYQGEPIDRTVYAKMIDDQLALLQASDLMEEARRESTLDNETLERLTAPNAEID